MSKVTIKVGELLDGYVCLQEIEKMPLKVGPAFWLARQLRHLALDFSLAADKRNEYVAEYGVEDPEAPGRFQVLPNRMKEYREATKPLMETVVEVEVDQRPAEYLGEIEVPPMWLRMAYFVFTEPETDGTGSPGAAS